MSDSRFGVFGVGPHLIGIPAEQVREMFVLTDVRVPPGIPAYQRGVARLRGSALPAVDLRVCLGHVSAVRELADLVQLLRDREQDHLNWLAELEASVRERRPFQLATDPRLCKFGKWFYAFKTDDAVLRGELARFEQPHAQIHALATEVEALQVRGDHGAALQVVERGRQGSLALLVELFVQLRRTVVEQQKEVGVLVRLDGRDAVLVVDRAEAVVELGAIEPSDDPLAGGTLRVDLVPRLARWRGATQPVLVLDLERVAALGAA
jgi:purine-binding chemotaxis protein CheW